MRTLLTIAALSIGVSAAPALAGGCASSCSAAKPEAKMTNASYAAKKDIVDTAVAAGSFKTLAAALEAAGLVDALKGNNGPFTVFAPTDEAFAKLPAGTVEKLLRPENKDLLTSILTYHVVEGKVPASKVVGMTNAKALNGQRIDIKAGSGGVTVDGVKVIKTDVMATNGVIHVIDEVIMPATDNLIDTALSAGQFNTLAAALKQAELVGALSADGPFTVFAPTDAAFDKLPAGTVETLLKPQNRGKLASILKYHVVPGRIYASDAIAAQTAKTLEGGTIRITIEGGALKVNDATVVANDIETSNGVIHVIDTVILP